MDSLGLPEGNLPNYRALMLDMRATLNASNARDFWSFAIEPTCLSIANRLELQPRGTEGESIDHWENLRCIQMETHRSFALSLGALWERNIRENLRNAAYVLRTPTAESLIKDIDGNGWAGLERAFKSIREFDLAWFPTHRKLYELFLASSAIRHGDGRSAERLYEIDHSYFLDEVEETGFYAYFAYGGYPASAVRKLDIPLERLAEFVNAIADFWLTIDRLRRSSSAV